MLIKEDLKLPDSQSYMISPKEQYLQAINALILKLNGKLNKIQISKQPQTQNEQIIEIQQFFREQLQFYQQKNKNNKNNYNNIPKSDILEESITLKQHKKIKTSSQTIYICSCHNQVYLSYQALGGHSNRMKKKMIQQKKIK